MRGSSFSKIPHRVIGITKSGCRGRVPDDRKAAVSADLCSYSGRVTLRQVSTSPQKAVTFSGSTAPLINRPHDKTLTATAIAGGEDTRDIRGKLPILSLGI